MGQAKRMSTIGLEVRKAVLLDAPESELFPRVDGRLIHRPSGRTYHPMLRPPLQAMTDDDTGEPLVERKLSDKMSNADAFRMRMDVEYTGHVLPLVLWYEHAGLLARVNAVGSVDAVHSAIVEVL